MALNQIWLYTLVSVLLVSLISLIGVFILATKEKKLEKVLIYLIALSAGALIGDSFIHLIPEAVEKNGFTFLISSYILIGISFSFVIEKVIQWRHCHHPTTKQHPHPLTKMNLIGDAMHNFIDGIIIAASYIVSIPVGIATTIAVIIHEIPQEVGDFGVLLYGGFTKKKAILANFLIALTAFAGAMLALIMGSSEKLITFLVPFAAGNFIYIACSDLIPELHKSTNVLKSLKEVLIFIIGILIIASLLLLE